MTRKRLRVRHHPFACFSYGLRADGPSPERRAQDASARRNARRRPPRALAEVATRSPPTLARAAPREDAAAAFEVRARGLRITPRGGARRRRRARTRPSRRGTPPSNASGRGASPGRSGARPAGRRVGRAAGRGTAPAGRAPARRRVQTTSSTPSVGPRPLVRRKRRSAIFRAPSDFSAFSSAAKVARFSFRSANRGSLGSTRARRRGPRSTSSYFRAYRRDRKGAEANISGFSPLARAGEFIMRQGGSPAALYNYGARPGPPLTPLKFFSPPNRWAGPRCHAKVLGL